MNNTHADISVIPSDNQILDIITDRIDVRKQNIGIVTGIVTDSGQRYIPHGIISRDNPKVPDEHSVFEIGSITKVFTKLLLIQMAYRKEVLIDNPVAAYLPSGVTVPGYNGREITLLDLATHTSGLPRVPGDLNPFSGNPYNAYSTERLYEFLSGYTLPGEPGTKSEYSNLGVGLLGHALARRADMDYESLVIQQICDPLGLNDTRITLTPDMKTRLAPGHDAGMTPINNWDFGVLAGGGGLRSTASDMLAFLAAYFGLVKTPLEPYFEMAHTKIVRPTSNENIKLSLGWRILTDHGKNIAFHSGGTGGYRTLVAYDIDANTGVTILTNTGYDANDIGMHILDPETPLAKPPAAHIEIPVDSALYDNYIGQYLLDREFAMTVTRKNDRLFAKMTGMAKYQLFPESEKDFFLKETELTISFKTNDEGYASELLMSFMGESATIKRMN